MLGCIDPVLTIAAASSLSRSPFLTPFAQRQEASAAHAPFRGEMSDQVLYPLNPSPTLTSWSCSTL